MSDARSLVIEFYDALAAGDVSAVVAIVEANFADDAVLTRPKSLPGGGQTAGAGRIARFMKGAASAGLPVQVVGVYGASAGDGTNVFADVTIDMGNGPIRALEWWTFVDGRVTTLQAFYWDTAAMLAPQPN
ncbi:nuclear transport factor 2 family protein [Mycolicibacterium hodleri]|uniref:Nuclear transport factor 2 family protein n=1 Tax=Mycolicibacterium hodleri TaxID=49897 RepID=A0A502E4X6_9MYCO|nr:nuclear transport factor 2 family protein [Mycolicibacterium hodleri]TPG32394.1 nuclear transport factor 2 family protein [Mycolicibacterium hodleri]